MPHTAHHGPESISRTTACYANNGMHIFRRAGISFFGAFPNTALYSISWACWNPLAISMNGGNSVVSDLFQLLSADLLDLRLPYLIRHPGRGAGRLVHLNSLPLEDMHLLCTPFSQSDVCGAPVGCLQGCLSGRFSCEYTNLVALSISEGEISCLFFGYDDPTSNDGWDLVGCPILI